MLNEKNRVYGKTKDIPLERLQRLFNHKELDFIKIALLFGSRARGENHSRSDYDFAILMDDSVDKSWGAKTTAYIKISKILKIDDCDIDIVDLNSADNTILQDIKSCYKIIKGNKDEISRLLTKNY